MNNKWKIFFVRCIIVSILCYCSSKTTNESSNIQTTTIPLSSVQDEDENNTFTSELIKSTNGTDITQMPNTYAVKLFMRATGAHFDSI